MSEEELEKYLKLVNHFISDDGNLEEIKTYIANVLYDVDEHYKNYKQEIERLHSIIKEVREYIENNSLYEQDYDYDYEENLVEYPPNDELARKHILEILDKENKEVN